MYEVQIHDQGKKLLNGSINSPHKMTGTNNHIALSHPQSNGLCELRNWTINDSIIKILGS